MGFLGSSSGSDELLDDCGCFVRPLQVWDVSASLHPVKATARKLFTEPERE